MRTRLRLVVAAAAAVTAASLTFGVVAIATTPTEDGPRVIELTIHHSRFDKSTVSVRRGELVRFVVHNTDPILHELIVGHAAVQLRHEKGTEPFHPPKPGEVSVPAVTSASTTYRASGDQPITYACHLPGHFAYGMHGVVRVTSR